VPLEIKHKREHSEMNIHKIKKIIYIQGESRFNTRFINKNQKVQEDMKTHCSLS
jgi:hypothetical protein